MERLLRLVESIMKVFVSVGTGIMIVLIMLPIILYSLVKAFQAEFMRRIFDSFLK